MGHEAISGFLPWLLRKRHLERPTKTYVKLYGATLSRGYLGLDQAPLPEHSARLTSSSGLKRRCSPPLGRNQIWPSGKIRCYPSLPSPVTCHLISRQPPPLSRDSDNCKCSILGVATRHRRPHCRGPALRIANRTLVCLLAGQMEVSI